jgi:hypothetical protein
MHQVVQWKYFVPRIKKYLEKLQVKVREGNLDHCCGIYDRCVLGLTSRRYPLPSGQS